MDPRDKTFIIPGEQIKRLVSPMGGCYASDRIAVDAMKVGYIYREAPEKRFDSGWRFMSGDESQEYMDNADNWAIYDINTICNYDPAIIPYLGAPYPRAYGRVPGTDEFQAEDFQPSDE